MTTTDDLRAQADTLRAQGDRGAARDLESQAMAGELSAIEWRVRETQDTLEQLSRTRLALIHDARDLGWSYARIGQATGLSTARIGQLIRGEK